MWKRAGKDLTPTVGLDTGWLCRTDLIQVGFYQKPTFGHPSEGILCLLGAPGTPLPQQCGICPAHCGWDKAAAGQEVKFGVAQNTITWDHFCCAQGNWRNFLSHFWPPFPCPASPSSTPIGISALPGMFILPSTLPVADCCFYRYQKEG